MRFPPDNRRLRLPATIASAAGAWYGGALPDRKVAAPLDWPRKGQYRAKEYPWAELWL
jgi:hypothetical protein